MKQASTTSFICPAADFIYLKVQCHCSGGTDLFSDSANELLKQGRGEKNVSQLFHAVCIIDGLSPIHSENMYSHIMTESVFGGAMIHSVNCYESLCVDVCSWAHAPTERWKEHGVTCHRCGEWLWPYPEATWHSEDLSAYIKTKTGVLLFKQYCSYF